MNTITYEFCPGDKVFGVHFYPVGAKIFEGEIIEIFVRVTKGFTFKGYKLNKWPLSYFPEDCIFPTMDEAKQARSEWLEQIKDKQHEEDFSTPSVLPYHHSESGTTTERVSAFRGRNS